MDGGADPRPTKKPGAHEISPSMFGRTFQIPLGGDDKPIWSVGRHQAEDTRAKLLDQHLKTRSGLNAMIERVSFYIQDRGEIVQDDGDPVVPSLGGKALFDKETTEPVVLCMLFKDFLFPTEVEVEHTLS